MWLVIPLCVVSVLLIFHFWRSRFYRKEIQKLLVEYNIFLADQNNRIDSDFVRQCIDDNKGIVFTRKGRLVKLVTRRAQIHYHRSKERMEKMHKYIEQVAQQIKTMDFYLKNPKPYYVNLYRYIAAAKKSYRYMREELKTLQIIDKELHEKGQ